MKEIIVILFCFENILANNSGNELIAQLCLDLGIKHPLIKEQNQNSQIDLMKQFFGHDQYVSTMALQEKPTETPIILNVQTSEDVEKINFINIDYGIIVVEDSMVDILMVNSNFTIDQEIFVLAKDTGRIFESYAINQIKVQRYIGSIDKHLKWDVNPDFVTRRSNFLGLHLKGQTELVEGPSTMFDSNYEEFAPSFKNNQTYLMNDYFHGICKDVIEILQSQLNFTISIYKRKDSKWGNVNKSPNGSYVGTGMIGDLISGKVDMILVFLVITLERVEYLNFMIPMSQNYGSIFISQNSVVEEIDFGLTFAGPFQIDLWIILVISVVMITLAKIIVFIVHQQMDMYQLFDAFWNSFTLYLGGNGTIPEYSKKLIKSYKLIIVLSLLFGNIVWIGYQAFLTAQLASITKQMPFTDLESLSKTDWTLVTFPRGFPHSLIFTNASEKSYYNKVYHNNMKTDQSFALQYGSSTSILQTITKPKTAIFAMNDDVQKSIQCKVIDSKA